MKNFKGTKGPWFPVEYVGKFIIQTGGFYSDSDDILECDDYPREEVEANALLISKAPEMLEMLESVVAMFSKGQVITEEKVIKKRTEIEQLIKTSTEL